MTENIERHQKELKDAEEARRRVEEERRLREEQADHRPIARDLHGGSDKGDRPTGSGTD